MTVTTPKYARRGFVVGVASTVFRVMIPHDARSLHPSNCLLLIVAKVVGV